MQNRLSKITEYLRENKNRPFKWGDFDCCLFACDIVTLQGGDDFAKDVRGHYKTEIGAKRTLTKCFGSIEDAFSSLTEVEVNFVQRGDLVLFETELGKTMTMRWADGFWAVGESGLGLIADTTKPIKAWRV